MARKRQKMDFAVIGLGRFGSNLSLRLVERGHTVLGIDRNRELVQSLADELTQVVAMDSTDEDALRALDIAAFDIVVVAIGSSLENNLMTTLALKNLGVRRIICKAQNLKQRTALLAIGANEVILPEQDSAFRLALALTTPFFIDQIAMGDRYSITEIMAPASFVGKTLRDLDLRQRNGVTVVAVEHNGELIISPPADYTIQVDDKLAVLGSNERIATLVESC
jgi:trk system potassium uptake protein TrkA